MQNRTKEPGTTTKKGSTQSAYWGEWTLVTTRNAATITAVAAGIGSPRVHWRTTATTVANPMTTKPARSARRRHEPGSGRPSVRHSQNHTVP